MVPLEQLHLSHVLQAVSALESIVLRSFGPEGGQVLFTRDTGQVMVSRSGKRILTALHLDHPLARMVVRCVWKHSTITGDGSKTFVLLLASLLRIIHATATKDPHMFQPHNSTEASEAATARHLADRLLEFALTELDELIVLNVLPHGFRVSLENFTAETHDLSCQTLLVSFFRTRLGYAYCDFFRNLFCELLSHWKVKDDRPSFSIQFLNNSFLALHTQVSGVPVSCSRLIEGQVIHRDFATPCPQVRKQPLKAVVFNGYLQPKLLTTGDVLELRCGDKVTEDRGIVHFSSWTEKSVESIIATLQSFGVSVLLCALKQSSAVLAAATQAGMCLVECVSEEEISLFTQLSGVTPISDCRRIHPEHIATLTFCKPLLLGAHRYVHLDFHDCEERLKVKPCSLVICAPSEGQADQHACAFQDAFRMLLTALEPVRKTQTALEETIPSKKCTSLHADNISNGTACRVHLHQKCVTETGCVISAGGTFEFLLHHALHQYGHSCSVSVNTSAVVPVSQLLAKALLSVPRQIYSRNLKHFLQAQTRVVALIPKQPHALSANFIHTEGPLGDGKLSLCSCKNGNMSLKLLDLGLESVSCKYQLVLAVLQCLTNLLRINMVLQTHAVLHTESHDSLNAHSESSEGEDED
ncbi:PREDICTED: Bardet-Biedl syndrome 10 protein isoform X1 [Poecilia mexicana]|uniref:Bardet-Biedl syndrome 10 n=1 Tax=Poecilia mexicana TaxID=48701 RepID=A0A3B3WHF7_9TELE|nr:PREDICTED: Bardet-Biedl syndrome 10 protein isoform X1 [Poecilia mexicana]XP_014838559.1 PREDICTED: Bardet-Biedl syndrome 10 protein isoform X1 [Poecilia mexicana]